MTDEITEVSPAMEIKFSVEVSPAVQLLSGLSGRAVGKIHGMSKANVHNWIKKRKNLWISPQTDFADFELDELFWFIRHKENTETRENTYISIMISRIPRQILALCVDKTKTAAQFEGMVMSVPAAECYSTDGNPTYMDVAFPGKHRRNIHNKANTHNVESVNADLRTHICGLHRRSRCFFRSLETLRAVLCVFINAYNKFGEAKLNARKNPNQKVKHQSESNDKPLHKYKDLPFSLLDYI